MEGGEKLPRLKIDSEGMISVRDAILIIRASKTNLLTLVALAKGLAQIVTIMIFQAPRVLSHFAVLQHLKIEHEIELNNLGPDTYAEAVF